LTAFLFATDDRHWQSSCSYIRWLIHLPPPQMPDRFHSSDSDTTTKLEILYHLVHFGAHGSKSAV
jgi:hypothetical protein